jgi:hypothetical protein
MSLKDTLNAYYMPLFNRNEDVMCYYAEIFEGINCLIWEATRAKSNVMASHGPNCQQWTGQLGSIPMLPGS